MKITHVINSLATGGAERMVVQLAKHGIENGHQVSIITLTEESGIPAEEARQLGIPVQGLARAKSDPRLPFLIRNACKNSDIVHVHLFPSLYLSAIIQGPKVYTEHSTSNRRKNKKFLKAAEKFIYSQYDSIFAISSGVQKTMANYFAELGITPKIHLAENGIADSFFLSPRNYSESPTKVVSIGSLREIKQHHLAIQAVAQLDNITLKIAGDGELRESLQDEINRLKVNDRIQLLGNVSDVHRLLLESDLALSTSKYEGFGLAVAEAQATGIPVVGPNVDGLREVVLNGKTGLLYDTPQPEAIAELIIQALSPEWYPVLSKNTKSHATRYSMQNSFNKQLKIYQEILSPL